MKKRLLIVIPGFNHGGTNRSLVNLLSLINKDKYQIDIFGMSPNGYYKELLSNYKILEGNIFLHSFMINLKKEKNILKKITFIIIKLLNKVFSFFNFKEVVYKYTASKIKFKNYNTIVAFQEGEATLFVSLIKNCTNKIAWIHCNYLEYLKYLDIKPETDIYEKFTKIVCVSEFTKSVFEDCIPELANKSVAIHNLLNTEEVIKLSKENLLHKSFNNEEVFKIISVGRIDKFKRFSEIPKIAFDLKSKKYLFKWFLMGGINHAEEEKKLFKNIEKYKVSDCIEYLGEINNPYPYIGKSDLLVSTSLSEAFPYVILEAKVLKTPVVVTDFGSAKECLINEEEGFITSLNDIGSKIELILKEKNYYNLFKKNLELFKPNNDLIINHIDDIL
jgi:glycosyltransferase involved in cell wall biosynthesis